MKTLAKLTFFSALLLLSSLSWTGCGNKAGTTCKTDADCFNGFFCAETQGNSKICIKKNIPDGGGTPDNAAPTDKGGNNNNICAPNATQACVCTDGKNGAQTCNADGKGWSQCVCSGGGCTTGSKRGCTCTDGKNGEQTCNADGKTWGQCACTGTTTCTSGNKRACTCTDGKNGEQTCNASGNGWDACQCQATPTCTAGNKRACTCTDGKSGEQTCNASGSGWNACACTGNNNNNNNNTNCVPPAYDPAKDPGNNGQQVTLDALDNAMFKTLRVVIHAAKNCHEKLWGGKYDLSKVPMYIVNAGSAQPGSGSGKRGFLLNHPNPPSGAKLIDSKLVQGLTNVYLHNGDASKVPQPGFSFDMRVGGLDLYAIEYSTGDDYVNPNQKHFWALFVHEAFHRIQIYEEAWKDYQGIQDENNYPVDKDNLAYSLLEDRVLLAGLAGTSTPQQTLETLYAIRTYRIAQDKSSQKLAKNYDLLQEWLEGTAMYTEHNYMTAIGMPFTSSEFDSLQGRLLLLEQLSGQGKPSAEDLRAGFTSRFYATGGIMGVLLDKHGNTTWKADIRNGITFYDIIGKAFSVSAQKQTQLIQSAKSAHNFTQLEKIASGYTN